MKPPNSRGPGGKGPGTKGPGSGRPGDRRPDAGRGPTGPYGGPKGGPSSGFAKGPDDRRTPAAPPRPPTSAPRQPRLVAPERLQAPATSNGWQRREEHDRTAQQPVRPRQPNRAPNPQRGPAAPPGTVWLYGLHAVAAAIANPSRRLRRLLLTEEAEATLAERLPQPWSLSPERTERGRIDHLLGHDVVHQGAALLADPLASPTLEKMLETPGPVLVLDQVSDPRNVGAILRSAAAFGAAGVITQDRNAPEETGALAKAASGALETVPLLRAVNLARTLIALKAAGRWVIGLDAGGAALSGPALAQRRVVLVLGAEGSGLRRLTRETCDELAGFGMHTAMESLNVSAAAAIALYEVSRAPPTHS